MTVHGGQGTRRKYKVMAIWDGHIQILDWPKSNYKSTISSGPWSTLPLKNLPRDCTLKGNTLSQPLISIVHPHLEIPFERQTKPVFVDVLVFIQYFSCLCRSSQKQKTGKDTKFIWEVKRSYFAHFYIPFRCLEGSCFVSPGMSSVRADCSCAEIYTIARGKLPSNKRHKSANAERILK